MAHPVEKKTNILGIIYFKSSFSVSCMCKDYKKETTSKKDRSMFIVFIC